MNTFPFVMRDMSLIHINLLLRVRALMEELVGVHPFEITCHAVCDALVRYGIGMNWLIGSFSIGYDHSWLVSKDGRVIIDPYPWAAASGPMLLLNDTRTPWPKLYRHDDVSVFISRDHEKQVQYILGRWAETRTQGKIDTAVSL